MRLLSTMAAVATATLLSVASCTTTTTAAEWRHVQPSPECGFMFHDGAGDPGCRVYRGRERDGQYDQRRYDRRDRKDDRREQHEERRRQRMSS